MVGRKRLGRLIQFRQQIVQVERVGVHAQRAVRLLWPLLLRPVAIQFNTIVVRIVQIERLRDAVVAGAFERDLGDDQPAQRPCSSSERDSDADQRRADDNHR